MSVYEYDLDPRMPKTYSPRRIENEDKYKNGYNNKNFLHKFTLNPGITKIRIIDDIPEEKRGSNYKKYKDFFISM